MEENRISEGRQKYENSVKSGSCDSGTKSSLVNLPRKKIKLLICVAYGSLFVGTCSSLLAPFFPEEAERKGATAAECGLILGTDSLVMFLVSPLYGKLVPILRPGFLIKAGLFVAGLAAISFGTLSYAPAGNVFVALAFVIRIIDALGSSAFLTASYAACAYEFSNNIGGAMSAVESAYSVGLIMGPALGGIFYEIGGFLTPFAIVGTLLLCGTAMNFCLFTQAENNVSVKRADAKKIFLDFDFFIDVVAMVICHTTLGFYRVTLEPHLKQFDLSPEAVGGIFVIGGSVYTVTTFLWSYVGEKMKNAQVVTLMSCIPFIICLLIVGPAPFFYFPTLLSVVIVSQVLYGIATSGQIMSGYIHGIKHTIERGYPSDVSTYGTVSAILFSAVSLGLFVGQGISGVLVSHVGYPYATLLLATCQAFLGVLIGGRLLWKWKATQCSCSRNRIRTSKEQVI